MEEGKDNDDRYRMVEDEFLTVAQQFTVHLHAAEYKRQQKAVKSRNAETINSISRPVTGKMTDSTRRKTEAAALAKKQRSVIEGLNGIKSGGLSDDSNDEGLPYVGTTLHGLMDSPRKKAASLAKLGSTAATRAAAGFRKPAVQSKTGKPASILDSPQQKRDILQGAAQPQNDDSTETEDDDDDDDDLDAPILAPKLVALNRKPAIPATSHPGSVSTKSVVVKTESQSFPSMRPVSPTKAVIKEESPPIFTGLSSSFPAASSTETTKRPSRLERLRMARAKKEEEENVKKEYDFDAIPNF